MTAQPQSPDFGCNLEAVESTARRLADVLDELRNFSSRDDAYEAALSSRDISNAIDEFAEKSSDQRKKVEGSVDALAQMLKGLADGVKAVDAALADSLPDTTGDEAPAGQPPPAAPPAPPPPPVDAGSSRGVSGGVA